MIIAVIGALVILLFVVDFYIKYRYINKNTDHVNLIKRYVELQRIRQGHVKYKTIN